MTKSATRTAAKIRDWALIRFQFVIGSEMRLSAALLRSASSVETAGGLKGRQRRLLSSKELSARMLIKHASIKEDWRGRWSQGRWVLSRSSGFATAETKWLWRWKAMPVVKMKLFAVVCDVGDE